MEYKDVAMSCWQKKPWAQLASLGCSLSVEQVGTAKTCPLVPENHKPQKRSKNHDKSKNPSEVCASASQGAGAWGAKARTRTSEDAEVLRFEMELQSNQSQSYEGAEASRL